MKLLRRTTIYLPTFPVLIATFVALGCAGVLLFRNAALFLSPTQPIGSGTLLIEGWVDRQSFAEAVAAYRRGHYTRLVTTGGPYFLDCDRDAAGYAAQVAKLSRDNGLADGELVVIRVPRARTDRTRTAAMQTLRWLEAQGDAPSIIDVYSEGPHARRSWLVYRRTLEPMGFSVGIITARPAWDAGVWWRQSEGVKAVVSEAVGLAWEACCAGDANEEARNFQTPPDEL